MGYKILIKASGSSSAEVFKFYKEPGVTSDYEVDTIEELEITYNELLNKYPVSQVFPIHSLQVSLNPIIGECGDPASDSKDQIEITSIAARIESDEVILTAVGNNLKDTEIYNWSIVCDNNTTFNLTSTGPEIILNEIQSAIYTSAKNVMASISIGSDMKYYTVKEDLSEADDEF